MPLKGRPFLGRGMGVKMLTQEVDLLWKLTVFTNFEWNSSKNLEKRPPRMLSLLRYKDTKKLDLIYGRPFNHRKKLQCIALDNC